MGLWNWFKSKPAWLKGGLIGFTIVFFLSLIFYLYCWIAIGLFHQGTDMSGILLLLTPIYGLIYSILAFIFGAIFWAIISSKKTVFSKGWKMGLFLVIIWAMIYTECFLGCSLKEIKYDFNAPAFWISSGILIIVCIVISFIVGKIKKK